MQEILKTYLQAIQDIKDSDKEHTYRTALENLLNALKECLTLQNKALQSIHIKHEPNNDKEGRGAPDFLITKDSLTLGYIENKRVNADLDSISQSPQIEKYLRLSDNLMLTDYLRFCLVRKNDKGNAEIVRECRICELSQLKALGKNPKLFNLETKAKELTELFTLFFSQSPSPIITAKEFANALAQRTRILKDEMIEKQSNAHIQGLFNAFKESLYKELEFIAFADSFAQTLTYSLFLARLNNNTNETITLDNAYNFIPKSFALIQAMSEYLNKLKKLDSIKWLIEEIIAIINHIDITAIIHDLNKLSQKDLLGEYIYKDPYLHLYEDFLKEYDESLREVRGVYYTPAPVVKFIIDSIDLTLQKDFNKQGLQSAITDDNITLLDFATGTGTFLLEAFRKALESSDKSTPSFMLKPLLKRFYGFEFLTAPYTIAHLKISQVLKEEFGIELQYNDETKEYESLNIMLTNTLYFNNATQKPLPFFAELTKEFEKAQEIKGKDILIITGNPPYSGASANKGLYEDEVRIAYGLEPSLAELSATQRDKIEAYFKAKAKMPQDSTQQSDSQALKEWRKDNACVLSTFAEILKYRKLKDNPHKFEQLLETHNITGIVENGNLKTLQELIVKHNIHNEKNPKWLLDDYVKFIRFAESKIEKQGGGIFAFISNNSFLDNPTFRGMRYHLLRTFDKIYILDLHGNTRKKETTPSGNKDDNVFDIMQGVSINIFVKTKSLRDKVEAIHKQAKAMDCHETKAHHNDNLATIYHYDLYGKRRDKYHFLKSNNIDSIAWETLKPHSPFYLFIPLNAKTDKEWSIKDIFKASGVGICSKRDKIVFHNSKESLKSMLHDFITKAKDELYKIHNIGEDSGGWKLEWAIDEIRKNKDNLDEFIQLCHYRPFDHRWTYYTNKNCGFMARPVYEVFRHFLHDFDNIGLVCYRNCGVNGLDNIFIANGLIDLHLVGSGSNIFPLYTKDSSRNENLSPEFRNFIDKHYKEHFSPEQILGYIYAVLFHKDYREKYLDFLKIDFPKIPFVESKEKFLEFSELGSSLISLHLLQDNALDSHIGRLQKIGKDESRVIEKPNYNAESKRLFINKSLYFDKVDSGVWEYKIGGYQVLDKYLKSHKGEEIDFIHFQKIIQTLHKSLELESKITAIEIA
ncbi:type ISP restriction/modification enzyme [Helicobacter canis]|uniref:site-specific DNA-methyltransferase (adenine-specific) n=1 Tax=Helicobacter canis TaxID=29419 RepID=A0A377J787_9HELI|nr:type ISP restriction/modification enzyme [Helicobacter canis]STO97673.1 adenine specific DNA methyltransferase [Helicobacter canis]